VSQRNLSDEGRAQARQIGAWFKTQGLKPQVVKSSNWCRCKETATLIFGKYLVWPALNSFFEDRLTEPQQTADLRAAIARIPAGKFEAWVTHGVNMLALTGQQPAQGEGFVVDAAGSIIARTTFT
jgi:phosphohistidine phosphatase SixA